MTAEIVDLQKYRQQKARAEKRSRNANAAGQPQAGQNDAQPMEAEAPLPEDTLEGEDGSRGGEPT